MQEQNKECYFCKRNIQEIDWRDQELLKRFITLLGKIMPRRRTGLCAYHQRTVSRAIKKARSFGLLSPLSKDF